MLAANGKVILLGEHAVVHGRPALVLPWRRAVRVREWHPDPDRIDLEVPAWGLHVEEPLHPAQAAGVGDDLAHWSVRQAMRQLRKLEQADGHPPMGFAALADADIPLGGGLGASAALAVLLVRLSAAARNEWLPERRVRERAHALEQLFHGTPSGIDDTAATYDGPLLFSRLGFAPSFSLPVPAAAVTPQALRLDLNPPRLWLGATGVPKQTRAMVERVGAFVAQAPRRAEELFDAIGQGVLLAVQALAHGDRALLGGLMNRNHEALVELGVGHSRLERLRDLARAAGAVGSKLTGGGGGGVVVALAPDDADERIGVAWRDAGFSAWSFGGGSGAASVVNAPPVNPRPPLGDSIA